MQSKTVIKQRLDYWQSVYDKLMPAYIALIDGGVKSYMVDDRQLTRFDLPDLEKRIERAEEKIDELQGLLDGGRRRRAFGVVPMD
ncbi:MAG: hypothetical protein J5633_04750 [Oscillospiraceae bacterium]|nr:hypothetical protein [Oscillospiraceae bacterium]